MAVALLPGASAMALVIGVRSGAGLGAALVSAALAAVGFLGQLVVGPTLRIAFFAAAVTGALIMSVSAVLEIVVVAPGAIGGKGGGSGEPGTPSLWPAAAGVLAGLALRICFGPEYGGRIQGLAPSAVGFADLAPAAIEPRTHASSWRRGWGDRPRFLVCACAREVWRGQPRWMFFVPRCCQIGKLHFQHERRTASASLYPQPQQSDFIGRDS